MSIAVCVFFCVLEIEHVPTISFDFSTQFGVSKANTYLNSIVFDYEL
jgi:hypothetical protein